MLMVGRQTAGIIKNAADISEWIASVLRVESVLHSVLPLQVLHDVRTHRQSATD